jgi:GTPase Era involved in 16S rRNA processing
VYTKYFSESLKRQDKVRDDGIILVEKSGRKKCMTGRNGRNF